MFLSSWFPRRLAQQHKGRCRPLRAPEVRRRGTRLACEQLEDRSVPSTLAVLNNLDKGEGSLRDTIKHADSGDTIIFAPSLNGQTIRLTSGALAISESLDIEGPGASLLAISGNNHSRVFDISQNQKPVTVTIAGLTIEGGLASSGIGGGILNVGSTLTLANDVLRNNIADGKSTPDQVAQGGAIGHIHGGTLTVSGCDFIGNEALGKGTGSAFGGAIYTLGFFSPATVTVINSSFTSNLAQGGEGGNASGGLSFHGLGLGGAIMNDVGATLTVSGCTFTGNEAQGGSNISGSASDTRMGNGNGGGLLNIGVAAVTNCTFTGNVARGGSSNTGGSSVQYMSNGIGGGIATNIFPGVDFPQSLTVTGCTFTNNQAIGGAGNVGGVITGVGFGGGLAAYLGATVTVVNSTFCGNQAVGSGGVAGQSGGTGLGGGIANFAGSSVTVSNCTFSDNRATGGTGGAGANGGNGFGGGVYNDGQSTLTITGSTITNNSATGGAAGAGSLAGLGTGGGVYNLGTISIDALTLIFGNTADLFPDCFGC